MSLVDLLESHRIAFREFGSHHHVSRGWIGVDCPQCSPGSGRFRLGLNEESHAANCWTCGKASYFRSLMELCHLNYGELREELGPFQASKREEIRGTLKLPSGLVPLLKIHRRYLERRGFDPDELVRLWRIEGIGMAARLQWRIFIPIALNRQVVSWTTRSTQDVKSKYKNAGRGEELVPANHLLYGEEYCRHVVIVCEGPADVWRIGPGAVCTFGVDYSPQQMAKISRYPIRVIAYDKDASKRSRKLCQDLAPFPGKTYRIELEAKDPGEASKEEVRDIRRRFLDD